MHTGRWPNQQKATCSCSSLRVVSRVMPDVPREWEAPSDPSAPGPPPEFIPPSDPGELFHLLKKKKDNQNASPGRSIAGAHPWRLNFTQAQRSGPRQSIRHQSRTPAGRLDPAAPPCDRSARKGSQTSQSQRAQTQTRCGRQSGGRRSASPPQGSSLSTRRSESSQKSVHAKLCVQRGANSHISVVCKAAVLAHILS